MIFMFGVQKASLVGIPYKRKSLGNSNVISGIIKQTSSNNAPEALSTSIHSGRRSVGQGPMVSVDAIPIPIPTCGSKVSVDAENTGGSIDLTLSPPLRQSANGRRMSAVGHSRVRSSVTSKKDTLPRIRPLSLVDEAQSVTNLQPDTIPLPKQNSWTENNPPTNDNLAVISSNDVVSKPVEDSSGGTLTELKVRANIHARRVSLRPTIEYKYRHTVIVLGLILVAIILSIVSMTIERLHHTVPMAFVTCMSSVILAISSHQNIFDSENSSIVVGV
jgi:hypothetical protein